ncbi:hypothetical protein A2215_04725 [Candidatus Berkelbacteria bacterium RIFOXYA2_FULL_43_10]|uniref:Carbohydrate-binding module family 96 domain-containing protein n=1 Tax=Candidatus Berkelbacteria bacterium RIFOXYA2_FULL_43_10 TaxID=1797472 RepID=A0A1F5EE83_9BACT|nr:MAG: hypothetical protein A2215_04725 [Candidatus Berkelbacteria bacterium RIFOXYA2_FULL_43_10]
MIFVAVAAAVFCVSIKSAQASTTVTIQPGSEGKDSYVFGMMAPNNFGDIASIATGGGIGSPPPARLFIEFDLSSIPDDATVESAQVQLYYYQYYGMENIALDLSLYRVTSNWDEHVISWNIQPSISGSASSVTTVGNSGSYGWQSFDATSLVQGWESGSYSNYGFAIKLATEDKNNAKTFYSSDNGSLQPKLVVIYSSGSQPPSDPDDPPADPDNPPSDPDNPPLADTDNPPADPNDPPADPSNPDQPAVNIKIPLPAAVQTVVDVVKDISKTSQSKAVVALAGTVSLVTSVAAIATMLAAEMTFKELLLVIINYLLSFFAVRKKEKSGVVYDQLTKQPVTGALVNLFEFSSMRLVSSALTDKSGKYFFTVKKGEYALSVVKNGYIYPSQYAKSESKLNQNVYFGQTINIESEQEIVNAQIPIDPTARAESNRSTLKILLTSSFIRISILLVGSIVAGGVLWFVPVPLNYVICGFYLALWSMEFYIQHREVKFSRIYDQASRQPIDLALVRVFSPNGKLVKTYVSDFHGRFMPYIEDKDHYMVIERIGYKELKENPEKVGFVEGKRFKLQKKN